MIWEDNIKLFYYLVQLKIKIHVCTLNLSTVYFTSCATVQFRIMNGYKYMLDIKKFANVFITSIMSFNKIATSACG